MVKYTMNNYVNMSPCFFFILLIIAAGFSPSFGIYPIIGSPHSPNEHIVGINIL